MTPLLEPHQTEVARSHVSAQGLGMRGTSISPDKAHNPPCLQMQDGTDSE